MKIKLVIDLELPDKYADMSGEHLRQILFDSYVNFATCHHLEEALHYGAEAHIGSDNEDTDLKIIAEDHAEWGDICRNAEWGFVIGKR